MLPRGAQGLGKEAAHRFKAHLQGRKGAQMQAQQVASHVCERRFPLRRAGCGALGAQAREPCLRGRGHVAGAEFALIEEFAIVPRLGGGGSVSFPQGAIQALRLHLF